MFAERSCRRGERRSPELAGSAGMASGVSLVIHRAIRTPTVHMNVRVFVASKPRRVDWCSAAAWISRPVMASRKTPSTFTDVRARVAPSYSAVYALQGRVRRLLLHPPSSRPARWGGIFFDDVNEGGFERCHALVRAVAARFSRRTHDPRKTQGNRVGERERAFSRTAGTLRRIQSRRRSRNVVRLQSNGRTEAILMSMLRTPAGATIGSRAGSPERGST